MKSSRTYPTMQLKAGTLLAVALAVTLLAMIFPTKGVNPFSRKFTLVAFFPDVSGLRASSPVWFSGMEVGRVTHVEFVPDSDPPRLRVILRVERRVQEYIKEDSRAAIKGMGLLGDMYIDLTQGSADSRRVRSGAVIEGVVAVKTGEAMSDMLNTARALLGHLEAVAAGLAAGEGTLGRLLEDPALYTDLQGALAEMRRSLASLNRGEGTAGRLLSDPALYQEMVDAVREIREVVAQLRQAEDKLFSEETKERLDHTVQAASRIAARMDEYTELADRVRFDLSFGLERFIDHDVALGHFNLHIWPRVERYYLLGIQKISRIYGLEEEQTTYTAQLAWRVFDLPLFVRGGLIKSDFFVAGADVRLWENRLKLLVDAYRLELNPSQVDVRIGWLPWEFLEITAGAEDVLRTPYYRAGLTLHYRDEDLLNVLFRTQF